MRRPPRDGGLSGRALIALILIPAFSVAPTASAEIFKCVAKNGAPRYQNFPCEFDSVGSLPSNIVAAKTPVAPAAGPENAKSAPVDVAPTVEAADPREVRVGMTSDEVRAVLGEPLEIVRDQPVEGIEIWRYVDKSVQLDNTHHVVSVESG